MSFAALRLFLTAAFYHRFEVGSSCDVGLPGSAGTYRWAGSAGTFFWIDSKAELIGMIWTQVRSPGYTAEHAFQRLVYDALLPESKTW